MTKQGGKIVGVGFQKTGTSSLRDALRILGYKVGDNNHQMLFPILFGNWKRVFRKLDQYDAVEDNPWPLIYKEIDQAYPNSKFILTLRDSESWYKSVSRHIGRLVNPMHAWIYGLDHCLPTDSKEETIATYEKHIAEVRAYFADRPNDFLEIDLRAPNAWEKLCSFIGDDIPSVDFPHANNSKLSKPKPWLIRHYRRIKKQIKYHIQISFLRLMGKL